MDGKGGRKKGREGGRRERGREWDGEGRAKYGVTYVWDIEMEDRGRVEVK